MTPTTASCARCASIGAGSPRATASATITSGFWQCTDLPTGAGGAAGAGQSRSCRVIDDARAAPVAPSLVFVTFDMPYAISGVTERNYHGTGLIIDAERGLVITDRNTVPVSIGDVRLTFAGTIEIPGKIVYVHPLHNLAVIQYDPKLIGSTAVRAATLDTERAQARRDRQRGGHGRQRQRASRAPRPSPTSIRCCCRCRARWLSATAT